MSSSSKVTWLRFEVRLGRFGSESRESTSARGSWPSVGSIIGDPGVWISSSIGRGNRGGCVRYDMSCRLLLAMMVVDASSEKGDRGSEGELRAVCEVCELGTATGLLGRSRPAAAAAALALLWPGGITSTGLEDVTELAGVDDGGEEYAPVLSNDEPDLGWSDLNRWVLLVVLQGAEVVTCTWANEGSGGAALR